MNEEKLVEVRYYDNERNGILRSFGWGRESSQHLLLISEKIDSVGLYTYTIIPRNLIQEIIQLEIE